MKHFQYEKDLQIGFYLHDKHEQLSNEAYSIICANVNDTASEIQLEVSRRNFK